MRIFFLFCLLGCLGISQGKAQQTLELMHVRSGEHFYFLEGDTVCLKLRGQAEPVCKEWGFRDRESLWLGDSLLSLKAIEWVDVSTKRKPPPKLDMVANFMIIAGAGYFALDQMNALVINRETARINERVAKSSIAIVGGGLLIKVLARLSRPPAKARIGRKYRIYLTE